MELKLVIFDLTGTTVQDRGEVADSFTAALAEHDIHVSAGQLREVRGASKREAVLHFIPEGPDRKQRANRIFESFRELLSQRYCNQGVKAVDGAEELFEWLRSRGIRVALNTGFDREVTNLLLTALQWNDEIVDAIVCGDDVKQGRPFPFLIFHAMEVTGTMAVQNVANVGDTVLDIQAGHNAGVRWNIGVLSGAHDREILERAKPTHLLDSITAIRSLRDVDELS